MSEIVIHNEVRNPVQFHHHGYVSGDPRVQPAAGVGLNRPEELPDEVDVLIVGTGPAGMLAAAQLSMFPNVTTRIIERRPGRLAIGQADGIQARSVETFQAFGFAETAEDPLEFARRRSIDRQPPVVEIRHLDERVGAFDDVRQNLALGERFGHAALERFVQRPEGALGQNLMRGLRDRAEHPGHLAALVPHW